MKSVFAVSAALIAVQLVSCPQPPQSNDGKPEKESESGRAPMRLWYESPAENWMTQALPIGNGELGAMFFGGIARERIQFNEKTLWTGSSSERGSFQNFGDVYIDMLSHGANVRDYRRELSISNALGCVSYSYNETAFRREYFSSFPDKVIVMRYTAPESRGRMSFTVNVSDAHPGGKKIAEDKSLVISGKLQTVSYEARLVVVNEGGTVTADNGMLLVKDADAVTILLAAATNYDLYSAGYTGFSAAVLSERLQTVISRASHKSYDSLKKAHLADYRLLFDRVTLDLKEDEPLIPTDALIQNSGNGSNYLDALYFQYGRYLMISSSRGMNVPNNLQGIWNNNNNPPWGCDIHSDINIQMNQWPAEVANLSECHLPFLNYVAHESQRSDGVWVKKALGLGHRGWAMSFENTIFGHTQWGENYPANAWYCMHFWQHYAYTLDRDFLQNTAWPAMKSACEFWLDRLKFSTSGDGKWEAPNEWSPEHGPTQNAVPYAQQLIWDLFHNTLKAADILGINDTFVNQLKDKFDNLDPGLHIGNRGHLKEWKTNYSEDPYNNHRHMSHLIGLYPGDQITAYSGAEFADAAKVSLIARGDGGTGWSRAWKISFWARLLDSNQAYALLRGALNRTDVTSEGGDLDDNVGGAYDNLLCAHPPFQIDGNFGAAAGIAEMLIQSHKGYIEVLPALPDAWSSGSFTGLKAQGNFTLDLTWENARPLGCTVYSGSGGPCIVRFGGTERRLNTRPGEKYTISF